MSRSVWKGPFVDAYVLKKAEAASESDRNNVIKIWSRRSTILPQFVGLTFGVYNGRKHIPVSVTEEMIGTARNANDADSLVIASYDAESRAASAAYLKSKNKG